MKKLIALTTAVVLFLTGAKCAFAENYAFITSCGKIVYWDDAEMMDEDMLVELLELYELIYCGVNL